MSSRWNRRGFGPGGFVLGGAGDGAGHDGAGQVRGRRHGGCDLYHPDCRAAGHRRHAPIPGAGLQQPGRQRPPRHGLDARRPALHRPLSAHPAPGRPARRRQIRRQRPFLPRRPAPPRHQRHLRRQRHRVPHRGRELLQDYLVRHRRHRACLVRGQDQVRPDHAVRQHHRLAHPGAGQDHGPRLGAQQGVGHQGQLLHRHLHQRHHQRPGLPDPHRLHRQRLGRAGGLQLRALRLRQHAARRGAGLPCRLAAQDHGAAHQRADLRRRRHGGGLSAGLCAG